MTTREMFEAAVRQLASTPDLESRCNQAAAIADFAWDAGCGYYSSPEIEKAITDFSDTIVVEDRVTPTRGHVLMVMTSAEKIGGHTRVVERWIEQDDSRVYSVVLTNQQEADHIPLRLQEAVKRSGGTLTILDISQARLDRAEALRRHALHCEKIVLHVDMDDLIALLAFGTEKFQRPVGFFNHADHVFWLGVSIADRVAEIRRFGERISRERRGVCAATIVGVPSDTRMDKNPDSEELAQGDVRTRLGIPADAPLLLTCGRANKYEPVLGLDLLPAVRAILARNPTARFLAIGFTLDDFPAWKAASAQLNGRLLAVGTLPNRELEGYYRAANIVIDSFPMAGVTALSDALVAGCPILAVIGPVGHADWVYESHGCCRTTEELVEKVQGLIDNPQRRREWAEKDLENCQREISSTCFRKRLDDFFDNLTLPHRVRGFVAHCEPETDLDRYHFAMSTSREDLIRPIGRILELFRETGSYGIRQILGICGRRFVLKWRRSPFAQQFPDFFKDNML